MSKHQKDCVCFECEEARAQKHPKEATAEKFYTKESGWTPAGIAEQGRRARNPRSTRRRVHGDYQARKFWEFCVISSLNPLLQAGYSPGFAISAADTALEAWRERWETPAEARVVDWTAPGEPLEGLDDYRPPIVDYDNSGPDFPEQHEVHRFVPVTGNRYCGECGGGKLHAIHFPEHGVENAMDEGAPH